MKVRIKKIDEIYKLEVYQEDNVIYLPEEWNGKSGDCPGFVAGMEIYCGKVLNFKDFNGWRGNAHGYTWTLPMFTIELDMNRNGANS